MGSPHDARAIMHGRIKTGNHVEPKESSEL